MDRVYVSWSHSSLSVHRGLVTLGWRGHSEAREVIVTARRERKEVVRVLTNGAIWRQSCIDGHTTALKRGGRWCSDGEIVSGVRRRDWSRGGCGG
jgi:hypothetical protein